MLTLTVQLTIIFLEQNSQSSFSDADNLKSGLTTWDSGGRGAKGEWRKNTLGPILDASAQAFILWSESWLRINFKNKAWKNERKREGKIKVPFILQANVIFSKDTFPDSWNSFGWR